MVRRKDEQNVAFACVRGGIGEVRQNKLAENEQELFGKGKLFNRISLAPGVTIGNHFHSGDNELYYILSGEGEYNDNGTSVRVGPGDLTICADGEQHGLVNDGTEPLEAIALILYS